MSPSPPGDVVSDVRDVSGSVMIDWELPFSDGGGLQLTNERLPGLEIDVICVN